MAYSNPLIHDHGLEISILDTRQPESEVQKEEVGITPGLLHAGRASPRFVQCTTRTTDTGWPVSVPPLAPFS